MDEFAASAVFLLGPALLVWLIHQQERGIYAERAADADSPVIRAPCSRCGGALVAAELLYVVRGRLLCESCSSRAGQPRRRLSGPELARLNAAGRAQATSRRRPTAAGS